MHSLSLQSLCAVIGVNLLLTAVYDVPEGFSAKGILCPFKHLPVWCILCPCALCILCPPFGILCPCGDILLGWVGDRGTVGLMNGWISVFWVALGGAAGAVSRYAVSLALQKQAAWLPLGTLTVNVLGCLLMGGLVAALMRVEAVSPAWRLALAVGFCGGFTTMSAMIYETAILLRTTEPLRAAGYVGLTLLACLLAFGCGVVIVRWVARLAA